MMEATLSWQKQIKEPLSALAQPESSLVDIQMTHLLTDEHLRKEDYRNCHVDNVQDQAYFAQTLLEAMQPENKRFLIISRVYLFMIANVSKIGAVCKLNRWLPAR